MSLIYTDLLLLDVMLPGEDGLSVLKRLRSDNDTKELPVILVTAKDSEIDTVRGLDLGADDYITKPFGVMELMSRIKAIMRRVKPTSDDVVLKYKNMYLDQDRRICLVDEENVELTFKEYELLRLFLSNLGIVLTREVIMDTVWGMDFAGDMEHIDEGKSYPELIPFTRKIRLQHEEILSAANIRQEFTANVSHELKPPLAAISGYAELMEEGLVDEKEMKRFSGEIRKSAARLLTLINDILKLSQLDAGNAKDILDVVNLAEITKESVEMLSFGAAKNGIDVVYEGDDRADVHIGKELAQELVYNLIENAVRYNKPNGRVTVKVQKEGTQIIFSVEDTGIGIPLEHQERIFERFYRVDKSRSKELGGTGLGLAIVKHICNLTDAGVNLMSKPGGGTKIVIVWGRGSA